MKKKKSITSQKLGSFIITIIHIHIQSHVGIVKTGSIFIMQAKVNTISAIVSSLEPNSLAVPVFLAIVPSIISVNPATKYKI